jgi:tetratricopeptide (TPR) repeat protein
LFNDFNSGSYLIGRGYPLRQVFIDGRSEFYGAEFLNQYLKAEKGDLVSIEAIVKKYDLQAALLNLVNRKAQPITGYFYKNRDWKPVFFDNKSILFLKNIPLHRQLIKKYAIDLRKYKVPPVDLKKVGLRNIYPETYISRGNLFEVLGQDKLVIAEAKEALRISPDCWQAYYLLGKAYLRQKQYMPAWEALRLATIFSARNSEVLAKFKQASAGAKKKK